MYRIFLGYPFKFTKHFADAVRGELAAPTFDVLAANDRIESKPVWNKIIGMIQTCDLSVFDITENRPNVCAELGYCIGADEPHIVAVNEGWLTENELLADLAGWDQLRYSDATDLGRKLRTYIEEGRVPIRSRLHRSNGQVDTSVKAAQAARDISRIIYGATTLESLGSHYGATAAPLETPVGPRVFDANDDREMLARARQIPGCASLVAKSVPEGLILGDAQPLSDETFPTARNAIHVTINGTITVRFAAQKGGHVMYDFARVLAAPFYIARFLSNRYRIVPIFNIDLSYRIGSDVYPAGLLAEPFFSSGIEVNVLDKFGGQVVDAVLASLRGGRGTGFTRDEIASELQEFWDKNFGP